MEVSLDRGRDRGLDRRRLLPRRTGAGNGGRRPRRQHDRGGGGAQPAPAPDRPRPAAGPARAPARSRRRAARERRRGRTDRHSLGASEPGPARGGGPRRRPRPQPLPRPLGLRRPGRSRPRPAQPRPHPRLPRTGGVDATAGTGDEDIVQTITDQLRVYPATEVFLVTGRAVEGDSLAAAEELRSRLRAPFQIVAQPETSASAQTSSTSRNHSGSTPRTQP